MSAKAQAAAGSTHRQIQAAHDQYFQDIAAAWAESQAKLMAVQTEFERATEKAFLSQDPDQYQNAMSELQAGLQSTSTDASPMDSYAQAFRNYKESLKKAIGGADVDEMTFTDVAHLGQSLNTVWPVAFTLAQSTQGMDMGMGAQFPGVQASAEPTSGKGA